MEIFDLYTTDTHESQDAPPPTTPSVRGMPPRNGFGVGRPMPRPGTPASNGHQSTESRFGEAGPNNKRRAELDNAFAFACDVLAKAEVDGGVRALIDATIERAKAQVAPLKARTVPTKKTAPDWYLVIEQYADLLKPTAPKVTPKPAPKLKPGTVPGRVYPSWYSRLIRYTQTRPDGYIKRSVTSLVGPAGNGKTTAAVWAGEEQGYTVYEYDCTEFTTTYDLVGALTIKGQGGGEFGEVWRDGFLSRALRDEKAFIVLNEYDALNPKVAMKFQSLFQRVNADGTGRHLNVDDPGVPDGRLIPAGPCPIVLTMNTFGTGATRQYVGRNRLDAANLDRISIIETGYENDSKIIQFHGFSKAMGDQLELWAQGMRKKIDDAGGAGLPVVLSTRTLLNIAEAVEVDGLRFSQATEEEFFSQIDPSYRAELR